MRFRHLTAADFVRQPWKNGGGSTTQLALEGDDDRWLWRLSAADVERSGPFSDFAGYERTIMLLEGDGMDLEIDGRVAPLRTPFEPFVFDGAAPSRICGTVGMGVPTSYPGNPQTVRPALCVSSRRSVTFSRSVKRLSGRCHDFSDRLTSSSSDNFPCSTSASTPLAKIGLLIEPARNNVVLSTPFGPSNSATPYPLAMLPSCGKT